MAAINVYLAAVADEAAVRGYRFDRRKIRGQYNHPKLKETRGQLHAEWRHLRAKLQARAPEVARRWRWVLNPSPHPLFSVVPGEARAWEKAR
jgi:hypothetical protein